jgi:hypothetical protein
MTLDDDQVLVHIDDRVTVYVGTSHGIEVDRVKLGIYVPGANATTHMDPKRAREVAAALIAFSGEVDK